MLFRRELIQSILLEESGIAFGDELSAHSFSDKVEDFLISLVKGCSPESIKMTNSEQDISEESLMRDLEASPSTTPVHISAKDVEHAISSILYS